MIIESWHWRRTQPLAETYIHDFGTVRSLYEYDPREESSWRERAGWLDSRSHARADRGRLAETLLKYQKRIGATEEMLENTRRLGGENPLVVIGGQQTGLFAGPMLAIWKAVSVIQHARRASRLLGRTVIPVYWLAGEDHDWEEVNHVHFPAGESVHTYRLPGVEGAGRRPVSSLPIPPELWEQAVAEASRILPDTEWKGDLLKRLRTLSGGAPSLTEHVARLLAWLFGRHGLVLVDSHDPGLRAVEKDMFVRLIAENRSLRGAIAQGSERVRSLGFTPQAAVRDGQAHLFVQDGYGRSPLEGRPDGFAVRRGMRVWSEDELLGLAEQSPERFSNSALTRPLMQEYLFPVLASVLGPSEIAYWGQLREAFRLFGMRMPLLVPRQEYTLVDPCVRKSMEEFGLTFPEAAERLEESKSEWLGRQDDLNLDERFAHARKGVLRMYEPLLETVAGLNGGMRKIAEANRAKIEAQIDYLERKAKEALALRSQAGLARWRRIANCVTPLGKPQERVYNIMAYLNRYGTEWLDDLVRTDADGVLHRVVYL